MALLSLSSKLALQNPSFPSVKLPHCCCLKSPASPSLGSSSFASSPNSLHFQAKLGSFRTGFDGIGLSSMPMTMPLMGTPVNPTCKFLLSERIVFLVGEINDFVAYSIITQLLLLEKINPTLDIWLFINSPGGSFSAAMAIFDIMQLVHADISTVALGIAASSASIILGGGTKGKRLAMPNARIMLHQPLYSASGQAIDVKIRTQELMHNKNNVIRIISKFSGRPFDQVEKDIDREHYMSPTQAIEYGVVDDIGDRGTILVPSPSLRGANYEKILKLLDKVL